MAGATTRIAAPPSRPRRTLMGRILWGLGWTLVGSGTLVLLYLAYLLWFTNLQAGAAQQDLLEDWQFSFGDPNTALQGDIGTARPADPAGPGEAYAVMWFEDGEGDRIVVDEPVYVVQGVEVADLRRGPGHYPGTADPGDQGNLAIAGHRTTYGAPFYSLDELSSGDTVHIIDRANQTWVYRVREQQIVSPTDLWVVGENPLGWDTPMLTLTTCHPRFSARQRLIVFAELDPDYEPPDRSEPPPVAPVIAAPRAIDPAEPQGESVVDPVMVALLLVVAAAGVATTVVLKNAWARTGTALVAGAAVLVVLFTAVFPQVERLLEDPTLEEITVDARP